MLTSHQAFARSVYYRKRAEATTGDRVAEQLFGAANLFLKMSQDLYRAEIRSIGRTQVYKATSENVKSAGRSIWGYPHSIAYGSLFLALKMRQISLKHGCRFDSEHDRRKKCHASDCRIGAIGRAGTTAPHRTHQVAVNSNDQSQSFRANGKAAQTNDHGAISLSVTDRTSAIATGYARASWHHQASQAQWSSRSIRPARAA